MCFTILFNTLDVVPRIDWFVPNKMTALTMQNLGTICPIRIANAP